ncbi:SDR family oxidoreductase [Aeromicrobium panaciterrae]
MGIGAAVSRRLAVAGASVVVADIDEARAREVADEIVASGGSAVATRFDITDEDSVQDLMSNAVDLYGRLDALHVNVADLSHRLISRDIDAFDLPDEVFNRSMEANVLGHVYCTRHAVPRMLEGAGGAIVYTSSGAAEMGDPVNPAYAMSKAALQAFTRHVASRWGKSGIRANAVAPGMILSGNPREDTPGFVTAKDQVLAQTRSPRLGTPEDVASLVAFLLSPEAEWINGQVIGVDGGLILR